LGFGGIKVTYHEIYFIFKRELGFSRYAYRQTK